MSVAARLLLQQVGTTVHFSRSPSQSSAGALEAFLSFLVISILSLEKIVYCYCILLFYHFKSILPNTCTFAFHLVLTVVLNRCSSNSLNVSAERRFTNAM